MSSTIAEQLRGIHEKAGISFREVAQLVKTTPETVSRWNTGRADPQPNKFKKIATLAWLVNELSEFYTPEEARTWLFTPQRLLGGKTPADRIENDAVQDVLALIKQLQDGAFV
jgi:transcriptional regulator with XRE-family HTH domain